MAVKCLGISNNYTTEVYTQFDYIGLTADTKPTLAEENAGSTFMVLDGAKSIFIWDGSAWYQFA